MLHALFPSSAKVALRKNMKEYCNIRSVRVPRFDSQGIIFSDDERESGNRSHHRWQWDSPRCGAGALQWKSQDQRMEQNPYID